MSESVLFLCLLMHYTFSRHTENVELLERVQRAGNTLLQEMCLDVYEPSGMATVCVLIGSFNNHPKWQTIG